LRQVAALLAATTVLIGCANDPGGPGEPAAEDRLSLVSETAHFRFYASAGDAVDAQSQGAFHVWATEQFGVTAPQRIEYFKYRDRAHMGRVADRQANGWADPDALAIHSIFPWHNHEAVHVYSALVGRPSDFFNEGIAVAMAVDPSRNDFTPSYAGGLHVHDWARGAPSGLRRIPSIVETVKFRAVDEATGYQTAGSFVRFLIDAYGMSPLLDLFERGTRDDTVVRIRESFLAAYGFSLEEAEAAWLAFLAN
jgi:hypothetical protein